MQPANEELMIRYLLRQLSPEAAASFESDLDEATFEELSAVEDALIDAYVRDELPPNSRTAFQQLYVENPTRSFRIEFARSLLELSQERADFTESASEETLRAAGQHRFRRPPLRIFLRPNVTFRNEQQSGRVLIPPNMDSVDLRLLAKAPACQGKYTVVLETTEGTRIDHESKLHVEDTMEGTLVSVKVPVQALNETDYVVSLWAGEGETKQVVHSYTLAIEKVGGAK